MEIKFYIYEFNIYYTYIFTEETTIEMFIDNITDFLEIEYYQYFDLQMEITEIYDCKYFMLKDDIIKSFLRIEKDCGVDEAIACLSQFCYFCETEDKNINYIRFFEDCGFDNPLEVARMLYLNFATILIDVLTLPDLIKHKNDYYTGQETDREDIGIAIYMDECLHGSFTTQGYYFER